MATSFSPPIYLGQKPHKKSLTEGRFRYVWSPVEKSQESTLVSLDRDCREIIQAIVGAHGELTPETEILLEKKELALCEKTDSYGFVIDRLEAEAELWKQRKEECAQVERVIKNAQVRLKERMKFVLSQRPEKSLQGDVFRFSLIKAKDVLVLDEDLIPSTYKKARVVVEPDRDKIESELKSGKQIPGAAFRENFSLRKGMPKK